MVQGQKVLGLYNNWGSNWYRDEKFGTLTFSPPAFGPSDNSTQAQFTHGLPPGSANKRFVVARGGPGH